MADWRASAVCGGMDPELFFPLDRGLPAEAEAACHRCHVRSECLADAARSDAWLWGVRGGLSEEERATMPRPEIREQVSA